MPLVGKTIPQGNGSVQDLSFATPVAVAAQSIPSAQAAAGALQEEAKPLTAERAEAQSVTREQLFNLKSNLQNLLRKGKESASNRAQRQAFILDEAKLNTDVNRAKNSSDKRAELAVTIRARIAELSEKKAE